MAIETKEITFEREIEYSLLDHGGYIKGNPRDYNREFAVDTKLLFRFLQESQPAEWAKLCKKHGDDVETGFLKKAVPGFGYPWYAVCSSPRYRGCPGEVLHVFLQACQRYESDQSGTL